MIAQFNYKNRALTRPGKRVGNDGGQKEHFLVRNADGRRFHYRTPIDTRRAYAKPFLWNILAPGFKLGHYRAFHYQLQGGRHLDFERMRGAQGLFIAGNQKRVLEVPDGYVIKANKRSCGDYRARLYRGSAREGAHRVELADYNAPTLIDAQKMAAVEAHRLASLPGLASMHAPECGCGEESFSLS